MSPTGKAPAEVGPEEVARAVDRLLRRAHEPGAGGTWSRGSARARARRLGEVGRRFLDPADPLRREALDRLPASAALSAAMAEVVLDGMARDWTPERLERLMELEAADGAEEPGTRRVLTVPPRLLVQLVSGSVPGVGVQALLRGLLVGAPTLLKPGLGDVVLPELFARGLRERDPELARDLEVVYWPGGSEAHERAALERAEVVVVYGSDRTVAGVRARLPATARLVAHHHREGIGVVGAGALEDPERARRAAEDVAWAVSVFDQRGCVSPRTVFVEAPGREEAGVPPDGFAELIASALERLEERLPSVPPERAEQAALQQLRGTAELLAAGTGPGAERTTVRHGGRAPWTVIVDPQGRLDASCTGRVVIVRPFRAVEELFERVSPHAPHLQTVGVAGLGGRLETVSARLAALGASRICPFRAVPFPPPWWHHDGRGPLRELLRRADLEGEDAERPMAITPPRAAAPLSTRPSAGRRVDSPPHEP